MIKQMFVIGLICIALVCVSGCTSVNPSAMKDGIQPGLDTTCSPTAFGNGTYYFPCIRQTFIKDLSVFAGTHDIVTMCGDGTDMSFYGSDMGYYVVATEK